MIDTTVQKASALVQLMRPENIRFGVILMMAAGIKTHQPLPHLIFSALLLLFLYGAVTAHNDINDLEIDRQNQRKLPLVKGIITIADARNLILGLLGGIIFIQLFITQPIGMLASAIFLVLGWAYSSQPFKIENRGLLATLLLAICYSTIPLLLGFKSLTLTYELVILGSILLSAATLLLKDFRDIAGDKAHHKLTPVIRFGTRNVKILAIISLLLGTSILSFAVPSPWIAIFEFAILLAFMQLMRQPKPRKSHLAYTRLGITALLSAAIIVI